MKKTFPLKAEGKNPERLLEATKHEIRKYIKRERRYVRHVVKVEDVDSGLLYMRETRDILSL